MPAGEGTLAAWQVQSYSRSLVFTFSALDLEIDMPVSGWGAFLVRAGKRVISVFASGALNERSMKTWVVRPHSSGKPIFGSHELVHARLSRSLDDWTCTNSMSGTELLLSNDGLFVVRDRLGKVLTDSLTIAAKFDLGPEEKVVTAEPSAEALPATQDVPISEPPKVAPIAPVSGTLESEPTVPEAPVSEPVEIPVAAEPEPEISEVIAEKSEEADLELSVVIPEPLTSSSTVTPTEDSIVLEVVSQTHGQVTITLPLQLNPNEEKILRHLARFGTASREDLQKIAGRRSVTTTSNLIHRLHEAGHPLIKVTEGQSYEFTHLG